MRAKQLTGMGPWHWRHIRPDDPALQPIGQWLMANRGFYVSFRAWLLAAAYSESTLNQYCVAARLVFGVLQKPYWQIEPEQDFATVQAFIDQHYPEAGTRESYRKGLAKFEAYWRLTCHRRRRDKTIHWEYYLDGLPTWLGEAVQRYLAQRRRSFREEDQFSASLGLIGPLTRCLRRMAHLHPLETPQDLTPARWFEYVDSRLASGIQPRTLNGELGRVTAFLRFLADEGAPIVARFLEIEPLKEPAHLPRDLPVEQLQRLLKEIETDANASDAGVRRMGVMDRAWFLLMLHSGLRTGEVRRLTLADLDFERKKARIEQSKGLKDRMVYLSSATLEALQAYLQVRGPKGGEVDYVFLFRHDRLSASYISQRLCTYGERCGVKVTAHQLRHSCATLLLNAGAPVLTIQTLLGHKHVDTTLGYARLYDGTVAADYYRAMAQVEQRFAADEDRVIPTPNLGELLALIDVLRTGTLTDDQMQIVQALRTRLMMLEHVYISSTESHSGSEDPSQDAIARNLSAKDSS